MEEINKIVIDDLNHLITICTDGKYGYQEAAEDADSAVLRAMFAGYSAERAEFSEQLKEEVRKLGGNPEGNGGAFGGVHRAWMDVKAALSAKDNKAVLGACIAGEQEAIKAYSTILKKNQVDAETRAILNQQRSNIEETLNKVEGLYEMIES
jgi:uncharacterized protein (TIGR02284 family)